MAEITHAIYGQISVRRYRRSRSVRVSVSPSGNLQISAPLYTPLYFIKQFLKKSEKQIEELFARHSTLYAGPMQIGKSHRLEIIPVNGGVSQVKYKKPLISVWLTGHDELTSHHLQQQIRLIVAKALRSEAKAYLPRRFEFLSQRMGFGYSKLRFSHAKNRWGSCSSDGVVSLNIALMKLDFELIDYVIIHELCHVSQMNHSPQFWQLVTEFCPSYKLLRKTLKNHSPHI